VAQGLQLHQRGEFQQAERLYAYVLQHDPMHAGALHYLGTLAHQFRKHAIAIELIEKALTQRADFGMRFNLGLAYHANGQTDDALAQFDWALTLNPGWPLALNAKGVALLDNGRPRDAAENFKAAADAAPDWAEPRSNYLLARLYEPDVSPSELAAEHMAMMAAAVPAEPRPSMPSPRPKRHDGLRLGFVSGDLRTHPVGLLIEGLLAELSKRGVACFIYASNPWNDEVTDRIRSGAKVWRDIGALPDEGVALRIGEDDIDVLIDLSGHSAHNRLGVFRQRAAPVQLTWLGYGATTGLAEMDFILLDAYSFSSGDESLYSERPLLLRNSRLFFTPPQSCPGLVPPPAAAAGHITFGCFNNLAKFNPGVAGAWAEILRRLPSARLMFKGRQLDQASCRADLSARLSAAGVDVSRVSLEGFAPRDNYFDAYSRIDIALDPFPFPGGTTSLDGLWMGVPVVTLQSRGLIACQGASILRNLDMDDWVADNVHDYVEKAVQFANDLDGLTALRASLRGRMTASALCDAGRFAEDLLEQCGHACAVRAATA